METREIIARALKSQEEPAVMLAKKSARSRFGEAESVRDGILKNYRR